MAEEHPSYGFQQIVVRGSLEVPTGSFIVDTLAYHPALRGLGIGITRARTLQENHGVHLASHLATHNATALVELSTDVAEELCDRWQRLCLEPEIVRWLEEKRFPAHFSNKLLRIYGTDALLAVEANPYCLLPFISFRQIDAVSRSRLGIKSDDPRRAVAAIESVLYSEIDTSGHTATSITAAKHKLSRLLGIDPARAIELAQAQGVIFEFGSMLQAYAPALMERVIEIWLAQRQSASQQLEATHLSCSSPQDLLRAECARNAFQPSPEQTEAILAPFQHPVSAIVGGAGVGKTAVLKFVARILRAIGGIGFFMAISGRATRRLAEALGEELKGAFAITTVARFTSLEASKIPKDAAPWIVVDEASMLDLKSAYLIISRIPERARLVLVGDPNQLPPIACGLVFHRIIEERACPIIELATVYRQSSSSGIPSIAKSIRDGTIPSWQQYRGVGEGVQVRQADRDSALNAAIQIRDEMSQDGPVQILTVFRGLLGASEVNGIMHSKVATNVAQMPEPFGFAVGEPVIYCKNDVDLDLQNGSTGIVAGIREDSSLIVRWDDGQDRTLSGAALWNCRLAYAITTHKSQGSQYERVIVVVPRASKILDRTLIYTAVTRARKQAVLVGDLYEIESAIRTEPHANRRNVLLLRH